MNRGRLFSVMVLLMLAVMCLCSSDAYADYTGTGTGQGGFAGCQGPLSTCYGAAWQWYSFRDIQAGLHEKDGIFYNGNNTYTITGTVSSLRSFARGTTINVDGSYGSCSDSDFGLWRYAMYAMRDYKYGAQENYLQVYGNRQVGVVGIDSNPDFVFDSQYYGGAMNYIDGIGKTMDDAWEQYNWAQKTFPGEYNINWNKISGADGPLAWFCAPEKPDGEVNYYTESLVNYDNSSYKSTGINGAQPVKTVYVNKSIEVNNYVAVNFRHNLYANYAAQGVQYDIERSTSIPSYGAYDSDPGFNIYGGYEYSNTNTTDFSVSKNSYYVPSLQATRGYFIQDSYRMIFYAEGTYEFCEKVVVEGAGYDEESRSSKPLTQSCIRIIAYRKNTFNSAVCGKGGELGTYTPSSGTTWVLSKANNSRLRTLYSGWKEKVYAMPGDMVAWTNCYFPGAQFYANYGVTEIKGYGGVVGKHGQEKYCGCTSNTYKTYKDYTTFDWTNKYQVRTSSPWGLNNMSGGGWYANMQDFGMYAVGDTTSRDTRNNYKIRYNDDVGKEFYDTISTDSNPISAGWYAENHPWHWQCCSCKCGCRSYTCRTRNGGTRTCRTPVGCQCDHTIYHCNTYNVGNPTLGTDSKTSTVVVPYNYVNTVSLTLGSGDVYAGETISVTKASVTTETRYNEATENEYATIVRDAKMKLTAYISDTNTGTEQVSNRYGDEICKYFTSKQCAEVDSRTQNLNTGDNEDSLRGDTTNVFAGSYNVFDASAGDYMCFVMSVFPATSGDDLNTAVSGDGMWRISAPQCRLIVKKPSMQVLGGSVFSNGAINTYNTISTKHNLFNISNYYPHNAGATYFGSWVEEAVIANGVVNGLASGAALGRSGTNTIYGLSAPYDFCKNQVPLSFANFSAASTELGQICGQGADSAGKANIHTNTAINRTALLNYFLPSNLTDAGVSSVTLGYDEGVQIASGTGKDIRYVYHDGDLTVTGGSIVPNSTRIVKANGNIMISNSIAVRGEVIDTATKVPKVVIYAAGDIKIDCSVAQVDAILIAGGTVYTCGSYTAANVTSSTSNAELRMRSQKQLVINGIVIADKVELARTYGNAIGNQSGTPAEIVNYDTSSLIWAHSMAEASESSVMTTVYQHELAPRY